MPVSRWLQAVLNRYGIPHEVHAYAPVFAPPLAHAKHLPACRVAKTVFLADHGRPVGVVVPASARVDLARVRKVLGGDLRFASAAEIAGWFGGCHPANVPPLRLRADLILVMDRSLAHLGTLLIPAGTPGKAVVMRFRDWFRAVRPGVGRFTTRREEPTHAKRTASVADSNHLLGYLLGRHGCFRSNRAGSPALGGQGLDRRAGHTSRAAGRPRG